MIVLSYALRVLQGFRFPGPLFLVAILYEAIGLAMSWIIKQLFWVPHRFRYGILVAGGWANTGDIRASMQCVFALPCLTKGVQRRQ